MIRFTFNPEDSRRPQQPRTHPEGEWVSYDAHKAELAAAEKRAKKADAERDTIGLEVGRLTAERDQALASVGAVWERTARMCRQAYGYEVARQIESDHPDATDALNEMLADAWGKGYDAACKDDCGANGYTPNPHQKARE